MNHNAYYAKYIGHYTWSHHQAIRNLKIGNDIYKRQKYKFLDYFFTTQNIGGKLLLKQCIRWLGSSLQPFKVKREFRGDFK